MKLVRHRSRLPFSSWETWLTLLSGFAMGAMLLAVVSRLRLMTGGAAGSDLAFIAAAVLAWSFWGLAGLRVRRPYIGVILVGLSTLFGPWLSQFVLGSLSLVTVDAPSAALAQRMILIGSAVVWWTPLFLGGLLTFSLAAGQHDGRLSTNLLSVPLLGMALAWLILPVTLALWIEMTILSWLAVAPFAAGVIGRQILAVRQSAPEVLNHGAETSDTRVPAMPSAGYCTNPTRSGNELGDVESAVDLAIHATDGIPSRLPGQDLSIRTDCSRLGPRERRFASRNRQSARQHAAHTGLMLSSVTGMLAGAAAVVVMFVARQLIPQSLFAELALGAGVWGGLAWGFSRPSVSSEKSKSEVILPLLTAVWVTLLTAGFPLWTDICLWISAQVSQTWLILTLRGGLLCLFAAPLGFVIGRIWSLATEQQSERRSWSSIALPWGTLAGYGIAAGSTASVGTIALLLIALGSLTTLAAWWGDRFRIPRGMLRRIVLASSLGTAAAGLFLTGNLAPARSERILFSSSTFASYRNGVPRNRLPWLDDGRLLAEFESGGNRWSVWRHRGSQVLTRRNGLSADLRSADPSVCPQSAAEVLPALLPLVLHPHAEHVLVLGTHPATLEVCHGSPLLTVTTLDDDPAAPALLGWLVEEKLAPAAIQAEKFRSLAGSPVLGLSAQHSRQYDVVVAPRTDPYTVEGTAQLTRGFYRHVLARLADDGLFCQRIAYYDLGPEPIRDIAAAMQSVFPHVLMYESVPGELLFVAAASIPEIDEHDLSSFGLYEPTGDDEARAPTLINPGVVARLQLPQFRRMLAQAGWDWTVVFSRGSLDHGALTEFLREAARPTNPHDSTLAFRLPVEVVRWDQKSARTREVLSRHGQSLGSFLGDVDEAREIGRRLEDLRIAEQVFREHPDQPWAYRAVLKKQLTERPRAKVILVKGEGLKHGRDPEDQRRKDYLQALGNAATREHPRLEDIAAVARYEAPFDPLLTYFVHHEVSLLLTRAAVRDPQLELRHRLNTVYFAASQDSSVRNVCETITLVCEEPSACPLPARRWDHLNGLLEVMRYRWSLRQQQATERSRYEPIDTERSIQSVERALALMDVLHADAGLSERDWSHRRTVLEDSLLQPLRQHRSAQLRQYAVGPR